MIKQRKSGFTIVELIVVIVVIAILAAITLVAYNAIQKRAMDTKIRTTVDDVGKALLIEWLDGNKVTSVGYWGNGTPPSSYGVDDRVTPDHLQPGYRDDLTSTNSDTTNQIFRYYNCGTTFALYASLNEPTDEDIANLASVKSICGISDYYVPISDEEFPRYNYGKIFK